MENWGQNRWGKNGVNWVVRERPACPQGSKSTKSSHKSLKKERRDTLQDRAFLESLRASLQRKSRRKCHTSVKYKRSYEQQKTWLEGTWTNNGFFVSQNKISESGQGLALKGVRAGISVILFVVSFIFTRELLYFQSSYQSRKKQVDRLRAFS